MKGDARRRREAPLDGFAHHVVHEPPSVAGGARLFDDEAGGGHLLERARNAFGGHADGDGGDVDGELPAEGGRSLEEGAGRPAERPHPAGHQRVEVRGRG